MIVITVADCPPKVRGDLSKWLFEISTGVFVGNLDGRVREKLWERLTETIGFGRATMVYSTAGEQRLSFKVVGTTWEPIDLDGITIMRRPFPKKIAQEKKINSTITKIMGAPRTKKIDFEKVIAIDLETTGLSLDDDRIIEIGAVKSYGGEVIETLNILVKNQTPVPEEIEKLTGLNEEILQRDGVETFEALQALQKFIEKDYLLIFHNQKFDLTILRRDFKKYKIDLFSNKAMDTLIESRKLGINVHDYRLRTIADYFKIEYPEQHRALDDCLLTLKIYTKLKEIKDR